MKRILLYITYMKPVLKEHNLRCCLHFLHVLSSLILIVLSPYLRNSLFFDNPSCPVSRSAFRHFTFTVSVILSPYKISSASPVILFNALVPSDSQISSKCHVPNPPIINSALIDDIFSAQKPPVQQQQKLLYSRYVLNRERVSHINYISTPYSTVTTVHAFTTQYDCRRKDGNRAERNSF
jgi:hypothetical protein